MHYAARYAYYYSGGSSTPANAVLYEDGTVARYEDDTTVTYES
jgi:hypothetical protein